MVSSLPRPVRAAVVGSGAVSHAHLSYLAGRTAFGAVDDKVTLSAVCDLSLAAAEHAASTFGPAETFTDLGDLLRCSEPDVVHVLTPPASHPTLVAMCLEAGAHVICEKPAAPTLGELEALLTLAARADRHLMESHNYRFNAEIRQLRSLLDAGRLGTVREVDIRISLPVTDPAGRFGDRNLPNPIHRLPAGVIGDFATHFGYLLHHLAPGVEYERIAAGWSRHGDNELFRYDDLDALLIGHGPGGALHARLRFDARTAPDLFTVTVRGSEGFAETDLFHPYLRLVTTRPGGGKLSPIVNQLATGGGLVMSGFRNLSRKLLDRGPYEGLHRMLDETYQALVTGTEPPVSPADMRAVAALIDRLLTDRVRM